MTGTKFKTLLAVAALALATTAHARADTSYTSSYCSDSSVHCITITLKAKAIYDNGNDSNYFLDRISATLDAKLCGVPTPSGTQVFKGGEEMSVDSGHTVLSRSWRVPAHCSYQLHIRHQESWPNKDDIFYHRFDQDQTSGDLCLEWDLRNDKKSSCL